VNKRRGVISKTWQLFTAAFCYTSFGLGAFLIGLSFAILHVLPFPSPLTKQRWIRTCIHKGCLTFIRMMRLVGLITYSFEVNETVTAERINDDSCNKQHGVIFIANHPSLIDAVMMFALHKNICCFVKGALWNNVFTGAVARLAGYIPNHTIAAVDMAVKKLHEGENLLIFPEGTRTLEDKPLHFKRGAANIAVAANAKIRPLLVKCDPPVLKKGTSWYKIPDGGACFSIHESPLLSLDECIDTSKPAPIQYRMLTRFLVAFYQQWISTGVFSSPEEVKHTINQGQNEKEL